MRSSVDLRLPKLAPCASTSATTACRAAGVRRATPALPPSRMPPVNTQPIEPIADAPALPAQIGKYRILGRLGEGATSEVFLGYDDFNGRNVAIKRVRAAALGDPITDAHY